MKICRARRLSAAFVFLLLSTSHFLLPTSRLSAATLSRVPGMAFAGVAEPAGASSVILNPASLSVAEENEASAGLANGAVSGINMDASYTRIFRGFAPASALFSKNLSSREFAFSAAFGRPERFDFLPGFSWGARAGAVADDAGEIKPDFTLGAQFPVDAWRLGAAITAGGESASGARLGGATYALDEYLVAADIDTKSKIYLGFETGVYGGLGRVRAGFNTRDDAVSVGFGAYLWPYALDVYYMVPFEIKSSGRFGFSFVYRFGGYNFSQVLLERNTEKTMYLEKRISDSKAELSSLNKKLLETEEAYRKARDFVDILDSEASEIIKQKLKLMKGSAVEQAPPAAPIARPASSAPAPKRVWPVRHRAAAGDSLRSLSQQYYGDANKWQKIYDANRNKIERGLPKIGEDITVPAP